MTKEGSAISIPLAVLEDIVDTSCVAPRIEALLPAGVRHRQLRVRTLILGMQLTLADRRPAYLTEVRAALIALPEADQARLGVTEDWKTGPHQLTYRQTERTFGLATFLHAAGITCSQRLGDIIATLQPGDEAEAVSLLGGQR